MDPLTKPLVVLPTNWHLVSEVPYPNASAEYDPQGAGMFQYVDELDQDFVVIQYERAPVTPWTSASLEIKAVEIFGRNHPNELIIDRGTMTIAGVAAGYAKAYDSQYNAHSMETLFIKGVVFFRAYANYAATHAAEAQVTALLNSIAVQEPTSISCLTSGSSVETGKQVTVYGAISPICPNVPVRVSIQTPDGLISTVTATTDPNGNYSAQYTPNREGAWAFQASWDGNDLYRGAESSTAHLTVKTVTAKNQLSYYGLVLAAGLSAFLLVLVFLKKRMLPQRRPQHIAHQFD